MDSGSHQHAERSGHLAGLSQEGAAAPSFRRTLLNAGCGIEPLPAFLGGYQEVRLDINPDAKPDIIADIAELPNIGPFDVIYTTHTLEHLPPYAVDDCLRGFLRVLKPGGAVIIFVPDLEGVSPTDDVLYVSPGGPVTGAHLFYGMTKWLKDHPYMAHRTGFIQKTLEAALSRTGFSKVQVRRMDSYNLFASATK